MASTTLLRFSSLMTSFERLMVNDGPLWDSRRPRGAPAVRVLSRDEAVRAKPRRRGVLVSIRAPGVEPPKLLPGWKAVLSLEIEDVDLHGNRAAGVDVRAQAAAIATFVRTHRSAPLILLHCHAGVSRSRSVAAAICDALGWPYRWTVLHRPLYDAVAACLRATPR